MYPNPKRKAINILNDLLIKRAIKIKKDFSYIIVKVFKSIKTSVIT